MGNNTGLWTVSCKRATHAPHLASPFPPQQTTHLVLELLQAVLAAGVMVPHALAFPGVDALLLAAVLVVAALAAVAHQEVSGRPLAAAAAACLAAASPGP